MHEIYHHTQKDKGLELGQEEAQANMIEKAYLNEIGKDSQEIEFDVIYAYTIKKFYDMEELEPLVCAMGGDISSSRRIYSNAIHTITEFRNRQRSSNNRSYNNNQKKGIIMDSRTS